MSSIILRELYPNAMGQLPLAVLTASGNKLRPTKVMVGTIVSGVINRKMAPIHPVNPRTISNNEATMIEPCTC